jgi:uncharacterized protein YkwD
VTRLLSGLILAGAFTLGVLFALTFRPVPAEATPPPCRTPVPVVTPTLMPTYTPTPTGTPTLLEAINLYRAERNLSQLVEQTQLSAADVFHANRLLEYGVCQHDTPPEGYTPDYRFRQLYGYQEQWIGEIGACGFANGTDAVQGWHNSEGHRGILVAPDALHVGVASVQDVFFAVLGKPWGFGFEVDTRQDLQPVMGDK